MEDMKIIYDYEDKAKVKINDLLKDGYKIYSEMSRSDGGKIVQVLFKTIV